MVSSSHLPTSARILLAALSLLFSTCAAPPRSEEVDAVPPQYRELEEKAFRLVNEFRQSVGLRPMTQSPVIAAQARRHSETLARGEVPFGHDGFERRISSIGAEIPSRSAAENIAYNQKFEDPAAAALGAWQQSEAHRRTMMGNFDLTGVGVARAPDGTYYFTQIFILRR